MPKKLPKDRSIEGMLPARRREFCLERRADKLADRHDGAGRMEEHVARMTNWQNTQWMRAGSPLAEAARFSALDRRTRIAREDNGEFNTAVCWRRRSTTAG